jgi:hypothetical protein
MKNDAEPPSCLRPPIFMIGQDSRGSWVVGDTDCTRGGLFVDRAQALRYIRFENGNRPQAFVTVTGVLELNMAQPTEMAPAMAPAPQRQLSISSDRERRVA